MSRDAPARPVLGVVCCTRTVGTEPAQAVMNRYLTAAMAYADAAVLLVPALPELMQAKDVAGRLDGLLLTGSPSNVAPARYGQPDAHDAQGPFDSNRDAMSAGLVEAMIARGKPVFGVCRGLQELNVIFGGSLRRDLGAGFDGGLAHHAPPQAGFDAMFDHAHEVALSVGGVLARELGRGTLRVSSVHFQGIDRLGEGLSIEARAPDGVIEAVSAQIGAATVLAVQWHPEWRVDTDAASQVFFRLLGRALRGEPLAAVASDVSHQMAGA